MATDEAGKAAAGVRCLDPAHMNLLGLLMKGLIEENLRRGCARRAARLKGDVVVRAGGMSATLRFSGGAIEVLRGASDDPAAVVAGDMRSLLGMVTGGGLVLPVLLGRVRIGGNPFLLLRTLPLIKAP